MFRTYGTVYWALHIASGLIVAVKKFKEGEDDEHVSSLNLKVRKTALWEIWILTDLKHPNIVNMIQVFRGEEKICLVFEYVEKTVLEQIDAHP